jgi:hypothetical protein
MEEILFSGTTDMRGCLSNERELLELCPDEFHGDNAWADYAFWSYFAGGATIHWKWKSSDSGVKDRQFACFMALLKTCDLDWLDRDAIAGWMLSEMLEEIPERIQAKPRLH